MTTPLHAHADRLAEIAQHLNDTPEATAPNRKAGTQYTSETGGYIRRMYHRNPGSGVTFGYTILAYDHITDISVGVQLEGVEARISVPGDTPADVIAHAVMSALHTTVDTITTPEQGA